MIYKIVKILKKLVIKTYKLGYFVIYNSYYDSLHIDNYISPLSIVKLKSMKKLGKKFHLSAYCRLGGKLRTGDYVYFGYNCYVYGTVEIGNYVMIAPNVVIAGGSHGFFRNGIPMIFQDSPPDKKVIIKDDVWIGANSVILPGVVINNGVVVGAGSVVTKEIPEYAIDVGNPAKVIKYRL